MTIALAQPNLAHGHDLLMEISHPDSPRYGQHLTHAEITEIFAPADEAVAAVHEWLRGFDIPAERIALSQDRTQIEVSSFVGEIEDLLHTEYYAYEHWDTGRVTIASEEFEIINEIKNKTLEHCDKYITPPCIKGMYNITDNTLPPNAANRLSIFEFGDFYIQPRNKVQCGVDKASYVISISYGEQEDDLSVVYQQRQCTEFMKLGMRGISVVVASGDSGVAVRATDDGNANGCLGNDAKVFNPDYPATCPYVTSVGATYLPSGASYASDAEVAVTSFPSGGEFSNIYAIPSYQADAVATYLNEHTPKDPSYASLPSPIYSALHSSASGICNSNGRGYPDLSAVGDNIVIYSDETPLLVGGTSASAACLCVHLTRINNVLLSKGKKPVGFVNPTLVSCGTDGFSAAKGWDPVTGLGTPNFPALLTAFCKAQGETC
ncbi:peptidase S8/S53 domain-containing protein [Mycena galopus ATCC 62051]|nr:peptidase S8/S53 domain-containing protein [Mycena galopus ATCC 62051]